MFQQLKNIDTAFKHIKTFNICLIIANVMTTCFINYECYKKVGEAQDRVHILYNGKVLEALASGRAKYLPVELRDHITTFHENFFNLSPDEKAIHANVTKALYLADGSAKTVYDDMQESGFYSNLIAANISEEISVDSIKLDMDQYPYPFTCYATEKLIRATSTVTRRLVTQGQVRDIKIETDNNPHGFLIEKWNITENKDINTENH